MHPLRIRLTSRKFIFSMIQVFLTILLPFVYKHFEISDSILLTVLMCLNGAGLAYTGANLISKKMGLDQ